MQIYRQSVLFYIGGAAYMTLEFLWRGRSHGSMFLLGGLCFVLIGRLCHVLSGVPLALRLLLCSGLITALELMTGLLVNQDHSVWDYRRMPCNFMGQICLSFSLLWIPVSLISMTLYNAVDRRLFPQYH